MKAKKRYLIFLGIVVLLIAVVLSLNPSKSFLFSNIKSDCSGRAAFMYQALYKTDSSADIVFFGSSRTMNNVNDSLMNQLGKIKFLNLGYCRYGRDLDYFFVEEYCRMHKPKKIILEVRATEGDNSHPISPFLLSLPEISEGFRLLNADVFGNMYNKLLCNLKFVRTCLFDNKEKIAEFQPDYGYWAREKSKPETELNQERTEDSLHIFKMGKSTAPLNNNSKFYFEKIRDLCDKNHITLSFLYFPTYGNLVKKPAREKEFSKYGELILLPDSILTEASNFSDSEHLNRSGANKMSTWLLQYLNKSQ